MWVVVLTEWNGKYPAGCYVAPPGRDDSYTKHLEEAQVWQRREHAENQCCGNERAVRLDDCLRGR